MTETRKYLISKLLNGGYVMPWKKPSGTRCYRLYDEKGNPIYNLPDKTVRTIDKYIDPKIKLWKKDKHGRMTFSIANVRKLHGGHTIKRMYKNLKKKENSNV